MQATTLKRLRATLTRTGLTLLLAIGAPLAAQAAVITFDDLTCYDGVTVDDLKPIPNGYAGLNWDNFECINGDTYEGNPSGYNAGRVSGTNVVYNSFENPAEFTLTAPGADKFNFNSVWLTGAWNDNLVVTIEAWRDGTSVSTTTHTVSATTPTQVKLNLSQVDRVRFSSAGGTHHSGYSIYGRNFVMDNLDISFGVHTLTATPDPVAGGSIDCGTNPVSDSTTRTCTATPNPGYSVASISGCGGAATDAGVTSFTTGLVTGDCTVTASFELNTYAVTGNAIPADGGSVSCTPSSVTHGQSASCTATPNPGYSVASISGCGGAATDAGVTSFTTGLVTGDCTVTASFALQVEGACGSAHGVPAMAAPAADLCSAGTASAVTGTGPWNWSCAGSAGGGTASCSAPVFEPVTHFSGPSPTGSGTVTVDLSGGGPFCGFIGTPAMIAAAPGANPATPAGVIFPHGLFEFTAGNCTPGSTITLTMKVPSALPATAKYWKWGPEPGNATPHWYEMPATIAGDTITFSITDGGQGDDDLDATNGTIVDQGGPGLPPGAPAGVAAIPTLGQWSLMLLGLLAAGFGVGQLRRRA